MNRNIERAEINDYSSSVVSSERSKSRVTLRDLRLAIASAGSLALVLSGCGGNQENVSASQTAIPSPAVAFTPTPKPEAKPTIQAAKQVCKDQKGTVHVVGMQVWYYDRIGGIPGVFEKAASGKPPIEPWIERPALGGSLIVRMPGSNEAINPQDFSTRVSSFPGFELPQLRTNAAFAHVRVDNIACTGDMTNGEGQVVPGVELEIASSQDPNNRTFRKWIPLGAVLPVWFGRKENAVAFQREIENGGPVRDLTDDSRKEISEAYKKAVTK